MNTIQFSTSRDTFSILIEPNILVSTLSLQFSIAKDHLCLADFVKGALKTCVH